VVAEVAIDLQGGPAVALVDWALLHYGEGEWLNDQNEEEAKRKKRKWGTKYSMALQLTGLEYQTLKNCVYVYEKVELSRRRDKLSWSHHSEVAPLNPSEQEELLERAERENWTRSELREAVRQIKKSAPDEPEPSVGFVAEPCINELLRGFSSEIQRRGSVDRWPQPVRQAWRTALKPIIKLYEDLAA
jgi:hypothetical protein